MRVKFLNCPALLLFLLFVSCFSGPQNIAEKPQAKAPGTETLLVLPPEPATDPVDYLTLIAVGDNIFHDELILPAGAAAVHGATYDSYYAPVKSLIKKADIAFVNQETVFAGRESGYSGYPLFNTPEEAGEALVAAGFDVVNHATNHIMDRGEKGILNTMDFWDMHPEIAYLGIHRSQESRDTKLVIIEKNSITVGFLSYTYGTNFIPLPRDKPYLVSLIDTEVMAREIAAIRPHCDFLVVSMHWGTEYEFDYSPVQENLAQFLADNQVDLIIGHHPHVLQKMSTLTRKDGGTTLCVYSLGNFLAAQKTMRPRTLLGGLLYIRIKKDASGINAEEAGIIPVLTHYERGYTGARVYPLYDYTETLAEKHGARTDVSDLSPGSFKAMAERVLGDDLLDHDPFTIAR
ncbi:capsular polysaccharide biosynthesis protein [Spirochaetia bacterium]|nr:capsular polysaccharide biosynthesis protein [Spirochaetia bacterium]